MQRRNVLRWLALLAFCLALPAGCVSYDPARYATASHKGMAMGVIVEETCDLQAQAVAAVSEGDELAWYIPAFGHADDIAEARAFHERRVAACHYALVLKDNGSMTAQAEAGLLGAWRVGWLEGRCRVLGEGCADE